MAAVREKNGEVDDVITWRAEGGRRAQTTKLTHASRRAPLDYKHEITPRHLSLRSLFARRGVCTLPLGVLREEVAAQTESCWRHLCFPNTGSCFDATEDRGEGEKPNKHNVLHFGGHINLDKVQKEEKEAKTRVQ